MKTHHYVGFTLLSPITICKLLYVFRCAMGGFVTIYLPVFWEEMKLTDFEIGLILTLGPFCAMMGNPFWGAMADITGERGKLMIGLACCVLSCLISFLPISFFAPQWAKFGLCLAAYCLMQLLTISALQDALVVEQVPKNEYGRLRLWCAVGYGNASGIVGLMTRAVPQFRWINYLVHFVPGVTCGLIAIGLLFLLQSCPKPEDEEPRNLSIQEYQPVSQTEIDEEFFPPPPPKEGFCSKLLRIPYSFTLFLFLFIVFICGCCMGLVASFLLIFIKDTLNGSQDIMGLSILITCLFEVPVFYFSPQVLNVIPPDWTLLISLFAYIIRFGMYWLLAAFSANAWFILFPEILHGLTFALMWCSAVAKANAMVEGLNLNNFAIGSMSAILTFGNAAGSFFGGLALKEKVSMLWIWQGMTYIMALITVIWGVKTCFEYALREKKRRLEWNN